MMIGAPLAQPIKAGISVDGRLIFADQALRQLHHRAGGADGGRIAVPGLAVLAALTHQLKMRLSRLVNVADADEDLALWVEAYLDGDVAKLSILSWQASPLRILPTDAALNKPAFDTDESRSELQFDAELRLVSAKGEVATYLRATDFGSLSGKVFGRIFNADKQTVELIDAVAAKSLFAEKLVCLHIGQSISVSGKPKFSDDGAFSGFICEVSSVEKVPDETDVVPPPSVLFGRQLAPVLRQPLGRIIANAETIGSELNGPIRENYALYAKDIANAARHLVALIDDLGDLETVEQVGFKTARDNIEVGDVARRVAGLLALKAADHSIRIMTPADTDKVTAVAEFRRVLQILLNLVTNAIHYSPDGTEVVIEMGKIDDASFIMVSDQGAGVAPEDRERIFEKFERLGRAGDGGSGLGLYISRALARAMGGDLTVSSAANGGAKFTLRLPTE